MGNDDGHIHAWEKGKRLRFNDHLIVSFRVPLGKARRRKGGFKALTLYDMEMHLPSFCHITTASMYDSKTMSVIPYEPGSYYVFDRVYNAFAELFRINRMESFFVVRAKQNLKFRCVKWKRKLPRNELGDAEIVFTEAASFKKYPEKLRLVRFHDPEQNRDFAFLTNDLSLNALKVANLYRNRWQVELFFKWIKQHLHVKEFYGYNENAVRIQIHVAIITYCLVAIIEHDLDVKMDTYYLLRILSVSLLDKTPIRELLLKAKGQNFEQNDSSQLLLNLEF